MSKNIYRVSKKSDLDEIMKRNFYKPICIVFVSKSENIKFYEDISLALVTSAKNNSYLMNVLIDFDDFIDNIDYFSDIKSNLPYFISYFKGRNIMICDDKDNFIPIVISHLDRIHNSYVSKLIALFNQEENNQKNNIEHNTDKGDEKQMKSSEIKQVLEKEVIKISDKQSEQESEESEKESEESEKESEESEESNKETEESRQEDTEVSKEDKSQQRRTEREKKLKELKKLQKMLRN
jgi:hypothetical protein